MRPGVVVAALVVALAGCVEIEPGNASWQPGAAISGELAVEIGPPPAPRPRPATLRIASWNVFGGADPEGLATAIRESAILADADVLLIQEIDAIAGEPGTRAARLAAALDMTWVYAPERPLDAGTHGNAIVSRWPLAGVEVMTLPRYSQPINERNRVALRVAIAIDEVAISVVDIHLDTRLGAVDRIRQLDPAVAMPPPRAIAGGDLNTMPWAWLESLVPLLGTEAIVGQDQAAVIDDYMTAIGYAAPIPPEADTHDSVWSVRLDAIFAHGLSVTGAGVAADVAGSDHFPVWIDVAL